MTLNDFPGGRYEFPASSKTEGFGIYFRQMKRMANKRTWLRNQYGFGSGFKVACRPVLFDKFCCQLGGDNNLLAVYQSFR